MTRFDMDNYKEKLISAVNDINTDGEVVRWIERNFPELRESEDEKTRKSLIRFLTDIKEISESGRTTWAVRKEDAEMCKSFIAYLEKQKENIEKEYVFRPLAGTDITIAAEQAIKRANEGDRLVLAFNGAYIPVGKGCNANEIVDIYDAFIEKQKENTWSEEDEVIVKTMCEEGDLKPSERAWLMNLKNRISKETLHISETCKENPDSFTDACKDVIIAIEKYLDWLTGYPDYAPKGKYSIRDMLRCLFFLEKQKEQKPAEIDVKALLTADRLASAEMTGRLKERSEILESPEKYGLCKPVEWGEKDEKMKERLITRLNWITYNTRTDSTSPNITFFDEIDWLKSLRPQPQGIYQQVVKGLRDMCDRYEQNGMFTDERARDFFGNVRVKCKDAIECAPILDEPSWKPSEEQMEAIDRCVDYLEESDNEDAEIMESLQEQLHKLI